MIDAETMEEYHEINQIAGALEGGEKLGQTHAPEPDLYAMSLHALADLINELEATARDAVKRQQEAFIAYAKRLSIAPNFEFGDED